jgi:hypothetical protein
MQQIFIEGNLRFSLDEKIQRVHHGFGSKRFEGQRAKREVAELER